MQEDIDDLLERLEESEDSLKELKSKVKQMEKVSPKKPYVGEKESKRSFEDLSVKDKVEIIDQTILKNLEYLKYSFYKLGYRFDIFEMIQNKAPTIKEAQNIGMMPNKDFLKRYLKTGTKLGVFEKENNQITLDPEFNVSFSHLDYSEIVYDYITMYDNIAKMGQYAGINYDHPSIFLGFEKDADFWDLTLNNTFHLYFRSVIAEYMDIEGKRVLDVGCGSVSPRYFGKKIGPQGLYRGIDISRKLLKIAENRKSKEGLDWVDLKKMNVVDLYPKPKYDIAIASLTFKYLEKDARILKNIMKSLLPGGKLIIFNEVFPEKISKNIAALKFFNSLSKYYTQYLEAKEIKNQIEKLGIEYETETLGNSFLIIKKKK